MYGPRKRRGAVAHVCASFIAPHRDDDFPSRDVLIKAEMPVLNWKNTTIKTDCRGVDNMDHTESFLQLMERCGGFELVHAYRDDEDHFLGGKGKICWYIIMKHGKQTEARIGRLENGAWSDHVIKGSGKKRSEKDAPAGSTIKRIAEKAYLAQDASWVAGRKARLIQDNHPHLHYTYGFGEKALDVSEAYGVTIRYSDINDAAAGFHERDICTGDDVEYPERL